MKRPLLSKSRFLAGLHCPLRLWYKCYEPELASEPSPAQQARFDVGHQVGRYARDRYPAGVLIEEDHLHQKEAMRSTKEALKDSSVPGIYEGAFSFDDVLIRADIMDKSGNGAWNLIEVKSGAKVKDDNIDDVALQHYVLRRLGFELEQAGILHLNNKYVYDGEKLDLEALFTFEDLKEKAVEMEDQVSGKIRDLKTMLKQEAPPHVKPSKHCKTPYACEFFDHCRKSMPEHWVLELWNARKDQLAMLAKMGIDDIRDIPDFFSLSATQTAIRKCVINDTDYVDSELKNSLEEYEYPIHFLDFETINPAIPRYANTRPYQKLPFQWSDHILSKDGTLDHKEYLCTGDKDPRGELAESLLDALGDGGDICIYGHYEKGVISKLAEHLPHYGDRFEALLHRCNDLLTKIRGGYYHPEFHGSFSLKDVLPVLVPSMSYENIPIQEGGQAGLEYLRMIDPETPADERERIRKDLLEYCGRDTMAMVEIREELLKRCR